MQNVRLAPHAGVSPGFFSHGPAQQRLHSLLRILHATFQTDIARHSQRRPLPLGGPEGSGASQFSRVLKG